ncbi:hypothetical protein BAUCODRAFT_473149 [Baudoinia panamericana UAMH 10762]|uniref:Major facilitator superfamily (MFS) profile domain-containing protein n=1 Tax=Baudoinia panamericana (strain UAMH 10762) TaxID=717646 RepID=M2MXT6_BAUPA|nr:uncharacterized protein BAUCODRAFT_473149 [Baudoinia panamericana UAMH 10762]EMC96383.1 hypothetical protein BAUCODRAFT_473149 [Baudoinia panamericana UAMH 10762]
MGAGKHDTIRANWRCLLACVLVSMSPFQYGVDFGCIAGIQAMVGFQQIFGYKDPEIQTGYNLTPEVQQLIGSLMTLGAVVASGLAGPIAWKLGRKTCLWLACILCWVSDIIMMATTNVGGLYAGRLLIGLANGLFMTFSQLYIQECAPAEYRGLMLSAFQFWTSVGTLIGTIIDNFTAPLGGKKSYLIPLGVVYAVPVVIAVGLFFIPESPRWLMESNQRERAQKSLMWLRPNKDGIESELFGIQEAIEEAKANSGKALFFEMFRGTNLRRTMLAVGAVNTQAASGAMFMIAYGTYFFQIAGIGKPFQNSVILVTVGVVAIIINTCVITRYGRRRLFLLVGLIFCAITMLILAAVYTAAPTSPTTLNLIVAMSVIYILSYNGAISSYAWLSGGELPQQRLRSYTFGLAASVGFLGAWLATFTAPYFINPAALGWGPKYGYIWVPSCVLAAVWVYFCLPEVKGRTLEEIDEMFEKKLPARKFLGYVCTGRAAIESMNRNASMNDDDSTHKKHGGVETIEHVYGDEKAVAAAVETAINVA